MSQITPGAAAGADFDLTQFYQVFFEEAAENLERMEQLLLGLDVDAPMDESLHAIFRCAHSVKGGAATFGFTEVTSLTHAMETLLDRLRRHEQSPTTAMVDTLLAAGDALAALLLCHQEGGGAAPDTSGLLQALEQHASGTTASGPSPAAAPAAMATAAPSAESTPPLPAEPGQAALSEGERDLEMRAGPLASPSIADDLLGLFAEVAGGGSLERVEPLPGQDERVVRFRLRTSASDSDLLDLCSFHVTRAQIVLSPWAEKSAAPPTAAPPVTTSAATVTATDAAPASAAAVAAEAAMPALKRAGGAGETIRVSVEKVDQLINLMGELVITQAMLSQRASALEDHSRQQLVGGLDDLERTTRDLQQSVMSMRMIPMSEVFNRFPRMLRDLAGRLGKQVELRTVGEATEMDKGLIEKITDPLTHLVRNSVDHGFELPEQRLAAGKPAHGTLTLSAQHEGGCIVIEVRDDGMGLDRERILAKARSSGMELPENMSDADVWQLIFAPGFSTAHVVTEISGRGVGMDVVKRNIYGLGGSVELDSVAGRGTCVRVRLPLTLAIMDGMSVSVAEELYLMPLSSVVESFQPQPGAIKTMEGGNRVVKVRDEFLPVVGLGNVMGTHRPADGGSPMLVLIQAEGRRVALEVDQLVGQQQVVVKNLEANYRKVAGISGATIMGDGSVTLILDVPELVRRPSRNAQNAGSS
jgi:two-component system, chemotaxis family, sensor kinase CheA